MVKMTNFHHQEARILVNRFSADYVEADTKNLVRNHATNNVNPSRDEDLKNPLK